MSKVRSVILALPFLIGSILLLTSPAVFGQTVLGDTNVEAGRSGFLAQYVEALTKITVTGPTLITSVSMYLQYTWSDGSQCLKFGIYGNTVGSGGVPQFNDPYNIDQNTPGNQSLIAATQNGYCFNRTPSFGPAWETWTLQPSDYLKIPSAGVYWLAVLPKESFGWFYTFMYTGLSGGEFLYNYGYFMYGFAASYALGFPPTNFALYMTAPTPGSYLITPFNAQYEYNAPASFYVTGT
ncbi:MAG: hypothetical protein ACHQ03_07745 [Candidatus Bathyarchaeia archaeon]